MPSKQTSITFWLTNCCNRNISLADLNLTIKAFSSINLMDKKHYSYNLEQLFKSATKGSIFNKRRMLSIRQVNPVVSVMNIPFNRETFIPTRERSILTIEESNYDELRVATDDFNKENEKFAEDNADLVALDEKLVQNKV